MKSYASLESPSWIRHCKRSNLQLAETQSSRRSESMRKSHSKELDHTVEETKEYYRRRASQYSDWLIGPVSTMKASSPKRPGSMRL